VLSLSPNREIVGQKTELEMNYLKHLNWKWVFFQRILEFEKIKKRKGNWSLPVYGD
jgi:hypothetical protein